MRAGVKEISFSPSWPSVENILPELKTVLPNADFVIEGYVDPTEPLRDEGPFGDHTGYYTTPAKSSSASAPTFGRVESRIHWRREWLCLIFVKSCHRSELLRIRPLKGMELLKSLGIDRRSKME